MRLAYSTEHGKAYHGTAEEFISSSYGKKLKGKVSLIFTSPPFPLSTAKEYGNHVGEDYVNWIASFAKPFSELLTPKGSLVMEIGNGWTKGMPTVSVWALKALLSFLESANLHLCQQFIWHNPAKLPTPAQWVGVQRIRVKDAFTHIWWMSPTPYPKADNRRVLREYSSAMQKLLHNGKYNSGRRPSQHVIGEQSFLKEYRGAIPSNVLTFANTASSGEYLKYCQAKGLARHPARMPAGVVEFFAQFLTVSDNLLLDPFAGSNTTGAVAERLGRRWVSVEPNIEYIRGSVGHFRKVRWTAGSQLNVKG